MDDTVQSTVVLLNKYIGVHTNKITNIPNFIYFKRIFLISIFDKSISCRT